LFFKIQSCGTSPYFIPLALVATVVQMNDTLLNLSNFWALMAMTVVPLSSGEAGWASGRHGNVAGKLGLQVGVDKRWLSQYWT
jgi:hypothetical protein